MWNKRIGIKNPMVVNSVWKQIDLKEVPECVSLGDDVTFTSTSCSNQFYDNIRDDGCFIIYFPVQLSSNKLVIKSLTIDSETQNSTVKHLMDVKLNSGSTDLFALGCKLSDTGMLWICITNHNKVIGIDLDELEIKYEFEIPTPKDICISASDEYTLYVAGSAEKFDSNSNILLNMKLQHVSTMDKSSHAVGKTGVIYCIDCERNNVREIATDLRPLMGIYCTPNYLYFSVPFSIHRISILTLRDDMEKLVKIETIWAVKSLYLNHPKPTDSHELTASLPATIGAWDLNKLLVPFYRDIITQDSIVSGKNVEEEKKTVTSRTWSQFFLSFLGGSKSSMSATVSPEDASDLERVYSTTDVQNNFKFVLYNAASTTMDYYSLPMKSITWPTGVEFDGHVTEMRRYGGRVILVNYRSKHVILIKDSLLMNSMQACQAATKAYIASDFGKMVVQPVEDEDTVATAVTAK